MIWKKTQKTKQSHRWCPLDNIRLSNHQTMRNEWQTFLQNLLKWQTHVQSLSFWPTEFSKLCLWTNFRSLKRFSNVIQIALPPQWPVGCQWIKNRTGTFVNCLLKRRTTIFRLNWLNLRHLLTIRKTSRMRIVIILRLLEKSQKYFTNSKMSLSGISTLTIEI